MSDDYADDERYAMASEFFPLDGKPTSVFMSSANADALGRVVLAARAVESQHARDVVATQNLVDYYSTDEGRAAMKELTAALADLYKLSMT